MNRNFRIDALTLLLVFVIYLTFMFYKSKFTHEEEEHEREFIKNIKDYVTVPIDDIVSMRRDSINGNCDVNHNSEQDTEKSFANPSDDNSTSTLNDFVEEFLSKIEPPTTVDKTGYETLAKEENNGFDMTQNPILHFLLLPFVIMFNLTMFCRKWAFWNFFFSIFWLSVLSYFTVWSISGLSVQLSIPQNIAGMTIIAAGSAIPDLVTGIVIIKKTKAISMSICAAIASNVFAILLGLGLPWTTQIAINMSSGDGAPTSINIEGDTLPISCILLLLTAFLFYFALRICDWKISYRFSTLCGAIFFLFIGTNIYLEFSSFKTMLSL